MVEVSAIVDGWTRTEHITSYTHHRVRGVALNGRYRFRHLGGDYPADALEIGPDRFLCLDGLPSITLGICSLPTSITNLLVESVLEPA
jgi:hypothetical protein